MPEQAGEILPYALKYIETGWRVFAVDHKKRPANAHGALGPFVTTPEEAQKIWGNGSQLGLAAATGQGLIVIDVDLPRGPDALLQLEEELGPLPPTRVSRTPTGGAQLFFRVPPSFSPRNTQSELAPGIDTRCQSGYVVLPPSRGAYQKDLGQGLTLVKGRWQWAYSDAMADLPEAWRDKITHVITHKNNPQESYRPPHSLDVLVEDAKVPGQWHANVRTLTAHLVARGRSDREILAFAHDLTCPGYTIDQTRSELRTFIEGARQKGWTPEIVPPDTLGLSKHIRIIAPSEIKEKTVGNWLVKGLIPAIGLGTIYGPPGSGKTFVALDMALAISRAIPWRECQTKQASVLYLCPDGGEMVQNRVVAYCNFHGIEPKDHNLFLAPSHIDLLDDRETDKVAKTIELIENAFGLRLGVIVVDTASRAMPGGDENAAKDVTRLIDNLAKIADGTRCIIALHHTPKSDVMIMRGHSALHGACDFELNVSDRFVTVVKQRDGETGRKYKFGLEIVEIGNDEDGNPVTSCVLCEGDEPAEERALKVIERLIEEKGRLLPKTGEFPEREDKYGVDKQLVTQALSATVCQRGTDSASQRAATRMRDQLVESGLIRVTGRVVWLP